MLNILKILFFCCVCQLSHILISWGYDSRFGTICTIKKREKHPWRSVEWRSKVAGLGLLKVTLLYGCIPCFLNCTNGTKSHKASHVFIINVSYLSSLKRLENLFHGEKRETDFHGEKGNIDLKWVKLLSVSNMFPSRMKSLAGAQSQK